MNLEKNKPQDFELLLGLKETLLNHPELKNARDLNGPRFENWLLSICKGQSYSAPLLIEVKLDGWVVTPTIGQSHSCVKKGPDSWQQIELFPLSLFGSQKQARITSVEPGQIPARLDVNEYGHPVVPNPELSPTQPLSETVALEILADLKKALSKQPSSL